MYGLSSAEIDSRLDEVLNRSGVVGESFRASLRQDLKSKVLRRSGADVLDIVGCSGSGRDTVAEVIHRTSVDVMGRTDSFVDLGLNAEEGEIAAKRLRETLAEMDEGTVVLRGIGQLSKGQRIAVAEAVQARQPQALVCILRSERSDTPGYASARIDLKPLHEREADIWELASHFASKASKEADLVGCRGLSRQAKADIAAAVRDTSVASVRRLRRVVRDIIFDAAVEPTAPIKLTSERVAPYIEREFALSASSRASHDVELLAAQFDAALRDELHSRIANLHGVSPDLLARQAAILEEVISGMDDVPKSYRNIMERTETVLRASLWALSGAKTQAEFRRFFGTERFMVPTKSVAWAFYNRVFKREG